MPNMSYCRFVNTVGDLEDCYDALLNGEEFSDAEWPYVERLFDLCADIKRDLEGMQFPRVEEKYSE